MLARGETKMEDKEYEALYRDYLDIHQFMKMGYRNPDGELALGAIVKLRRNQIQELDQMVQDSVLVGTSEMKDNHPRIPGL
jgi:hypothetical protein